MNIKNLFSLSFFSIFLFTSFYGSFSFSIESPKGDYVVVLHGLTPDYDNEVKGLGDFLQEEGYDVIGFTYPAASHSMEELIEIVSQKITPFIVEDKPVHFVGYSMGGILARLIVSQHRPHMLGRVVQLGAPNQGSEIANFLTAGAWRKKFYYSIYGPAGLQMSTEGIKSLQPLLGEVDYELGVIAGDKTSFFKNPTYKISSMFVIPGTDDGRVSLEEANIESATDYVIVPSTHDTIPHDKNSHLQTLHFLKYGVFNHQL